MDQTEAEHHWPKESSYTECLEQQSEKAMKMQQLGYINEIPFNFQQLKSRPVEWYPQKQKEA